MSKKTGMNGDTFKKKNHIKKKRPAPEKWWVYAHQRPKIL